MGLPPLWFWRLATRSRALNENLRNSVMESNDDQCLNVIVHACRVLHAAHLSNNTWGFVALRDPIGRGIWVTPDAMGFDEIEAPDIVLVSHRGDVIAGVGAPDDESAIGVWAMSDWPMIRAVVHVHSLYAAAFSSTDAALNALSHEGCHLVPPDVVRIHSLSTWEKDSGLASLLGERGAVLLRGHGMVTGAETLGRAVALAVYLEKSCRLQLMVGSGYVVSDEEVLEKRSGQVARPGISWEYMKRVTPIPRADCR